MECQECLDRRKERKQEQRKNGKCVNHPNIDVAFGHMVCQKCVDYWKKYCRDPKNRKGYLERALKRNGSLKNIKHKFTNEEWVKKINNTKGVCPGYNREPHFVGIDNLTLDHIYPISKANEDFVLTKIKRIYKIEDIIPLCKSCNSSKSNNMSISPR